MERQPEGLKYNGNFSVEVQNASDLADFISAIREAAQQPFLAPSAENLPMELGGVAIQDDFLEGIGCGFQYDVLRDQYALEAHFSLKRNDVLDESEDSGVVRLRSNAVLLDLSSILGSKTGESTIDLASVKQSVQSFLSDTEVEVEKDGRGADKLVFRMLSDTEEDGPAIALHRAGHPLYEAYCLHLKDFFEGDESRLLSNFEYFAHLTESMMRAIYDSQGKLAPDAKLVIAPPEDVKSGMKLVRQQAAAYKSFSGDLVSAGVEEDVKKMIVVEKPNVTFDDIGGQERAKDELRTLVDFLKHPEDFKAGGVRPRSGAIIHGPKGVGKTRLGKAVANESGATFFNVRLSDIIHGLVGRTPKIITELFRQASENQPAVIFIDEIDAIAPSRDQNSDYMRQVTSAILVEMNGLLERGSSVVVIAATNRLDLVDDALRRPQRFDLEIEAKKPDDIGKEQIINIVIREAIERSGRRKGALFGRLNLADIKSAMRGFSGADIEEVFQRALLKKVKSKRQGVSLGPVSTADILFEIKGYERAERQKSTGLSAYS